MVGVVVTKSAPHSMAMALSLKITLFVSEDERVQNAKQQSVVDCPNNERVGADKWKEV